MGQVISVMVDGGKANAGPLGPSLGPTGINIGEVVQAINKATAEFNGMQVPVEIQIGDKKDFTIKVGTPPAQALIKEKTGITSGSGNPKTTFVADLKLEDAISIAKMKGGDLLGADLRRKVTEIVGTCTSMGVTFEGMNPREASQALRDGKFDDRF